MNDFEFKKVISLDCSFIISILFLFILGMIFGGIEKAILLVGLYLIITAIIKIIRNTF